MLRYGVPWSLTVLKVGGSYTPNRTTASGFLRGENGPVKRPIPHGDVGHATAPHRDVGHAAPVRRRAAAMPAAAAPGSGAPVMGRPITRRSAPAARASSGVATRAWSC